MCVQIYTFTFWSQIIHLLYHFGIIRSSTFTLALFVFIFGTPIVWINEHLHRDEFKNVDWFRISLVAHVGHILPLIVLILRKKTQLTWKPLLYPICIYVIVMALVDINPLTMYLNLIGFARHWKK